jgi:hypothetical protein
MVVIAEAIACFKWSLGIGCSHFGDLDVKIPQQGRRAIASLYTNPSDFDLRHEQSHPRRCLIPADTTPSQQTQSCGILDASAPPKRTGVNFMAFFNLSKTIEQVNYTNSRGTSIIHISQPIPDP